MYTGAPGYCSPTLLLQTICIYGVYLFTVPEVTYTRWLKGALSSLAAILIDLLPVFQVFKEVLVTRGGIVSTLRPGASHNSLRALSIMMYS